MKRIFKYVAQFIIEVIWFVPGVLMNAFGYPYCIMQNMRYGGLSFKNAMHETNELYKELFAEIVEIKHEWILK